MVVVLVIVGAENYANQALTMPGMLHMAESIFNREPELSK
jgi:hypothetical protein